MRIAVNIDGQFGGKMTGVQNYVDSLLSALYASGTRHQITAFAPLLFSSAALQQAGAEGGFLWRQYPRAGVDTGGSAFLLSAAPGVTRSRRLSSWAQRADATALWRFKQGTLAARARMASRKYDLLHLPSTLPLPLDRLAARHNTVTIYDLTIRLYAGAHHPDNVAAWERVFEHAQRCSRVIAISESTKRDIVAHLRIPEDRIDVTPLAPRVSTRRVEDPRTLRAALSAFDLADTPFVLYGGSLEPRKNLPQLVRAFARVCRECPHLPHQLVLAGGSWDGHDDVLRRLAQDENIGERVILTGYIPDDQMNALMTACDTFAYISEYEGFGLPPLEAMVCGAPVITSGTSSLPEVVGDAGIQVAFRDTEAIAAALHHLLTDRVANARRRALSLERARLFTWERTAALTLRSYEAAVQ